MWFLIYSQLLQHVTIMRQNSECTGTKTELAEQGKTKTKKRSRKTAMKWRPQKGMMQISQFECNNLLHLNEKYLEYMRPLKALLISFMYRFLQKHNTSISRAGFFGNIFCSCLHILDAFKKNDYQLIKLMVYVNSYVGHFQ